MYRLVAPQLDVGAPGACRGLFAIQSSTQRQVALNDGKGLLFPERTGTSKAHRTFWANLVEILR